MAVSVPPEPGTVLRYRDRLWVVLPEEHDGLLTLRPVAGSERECVTVDLEAIEALRAVCPHEDLERDRFPTPEPDDYADEIAVRLVTQAARLLIRRGATPFRCLGRLGFRPRAYQLVPLMMALRHRPVVRLLIADDVGVGKTLEAGLILRELLDRGVIRRSAVICPPQLCEQWQVELRDKLGIEAVIVRGATISQLERRLSGDQSIFSYYPHIVASIDTVKNPRTYRSAFLQHCPEFVIVDEVHGAARPPRYDLYSGEMQRYELVKEIAAKRDRHLVLLTATPHSGVEESFRSLLEFLDPSFGHVDWSNADGEATRRLAQHYIQRQREDLRQYLDGTRFPKRHHEELPYRFTNGYELLYRRAVDLAWDLLDFVADQDEQRRRPCYWAALALLRCISSSPAAGERALRSRARTDEEEIERRDTSADIDASEIVHLARVRAEEVGEPPEDQEAGGRDTLPSVSDEMIAQLGRKVRRRLEELAGKCVELQGPEKDGKLRVAMRKLIDWVRQGTNPIVWCRYIATAEYVADQLRQYINEHCPDLDVEVESITGALTEEDRARRLQRLAEAERRILVATDCISEGTNLQEHYSAVLHYDLPWNPNRLEQREGRVDRFGQPRERVYAATLVGENNPLDGAVLDVLLRKAREIMNATGIFVPVPIQNEAVLESILAHLLARAEGRQQQRRLWLQEEFQRSVEAVDQLKEQWEEAAKMETARRRVFQGAWISEEEVRREIERADSVLGNPRDVIEFVAHALPAIGYERPRLGGDTRLTIDLSDGSRALPESLRWKLGPHLPREQKWRLSCESPPPEGYSYLGRTHTLVEGLAEIVLYRALAERAQLAQPEALRRVAEQPAAQSSHRTLARNGVIRTRAVDVTTTIFVIRPRYLVEIGKSTGLAEEVICLAVRRLSDPQPLPLIEGRRLLDQARAEQNVTEPEKREWLRRAIDELWRDLVGRRIVEQVIEQRIQELASGHRSLQDEELELTIRKVPQEEPDLVAVLVLLPAITG